MICFDEWVLTLCWTWPKARCSSCTPFFFSLNKCNMLFCAPVNFCFPTCFFGMPWCFSITWRTLVYDFQDGSGCLFCCCLAFAIFLIVAWFPLKSWPPQLHPVLCTCAAKGNPSQLWKPREPGPLSESWYMTNFLFRGLNSWGKMQR